VSARLETIYARSDLIVGRRLDREYVLVPLRARGADLDAFFSLNPLAAFIWERLDGRSSGRAIVRAIVAEFDVAEEQAAADYLRFIEQLRSIDALTRHSPKLA
jgi:hypothetical protein